MSHSSDLLKEMPFSITVAYFSSGTVSLDLDKVECYYLLPIDVVGPKLRYGSRNWVLSEEKTDER